MCPLSINTANIATIYKNDHSSTFGISLAKQITKRISTVIFCAKVEVTLAQTTAKILKQENLKKFTLFTNQKLKTLYILKYMPNSNTFHRPNKRIKFLQKVVYFISCLNRVFVSLSLTRDTRPIQEVFLSLCAKANIEVIFSKNLTKMRCGKDFKDYVLKNPQINPIQNISQDLLISKA